MTALTIDAAGWLQTVDVMRSPNFDARPGNTKIRLIVIHAISLPPGEFGGGHIQQFFSNQIDEKVHPYFAGICDMRVSAHCLIARGGEITQFVSFSDRAWHAGVSNWCGEDACNDFSIGIELEGTDELAYNEEQYCRLEDLIHCLRARYPNITERAICGHSDIAPGRKTDPGLAFDWARVNKAMVV
ncbi:MAG: 1,6-anhydro-N-acetylmuramyl-L-alanine amidase AmpD [Gammaproteobacteria bacterium]|nr:1,6-anhydro-N-acetylmuramyl-L-alanine amidase AmpD [Gammaproteobacteria bacterium]